MGKKKKWHCGANKDSMTPKQRLFVQEYLKSLNAADAARKAGYSVKTAQQIGAENLSKPVIRARIDSELQKIENAKIADVKEVMELLTVAARGEMKEEVILFDMEGGMHNEEKQISPRGRIKSPELRGRR